jgi:signal transduction histidine kinase
MTFTQLLHSFFNFLGTTEGELLKTSVELMLFTIVAYMIISEWTRSRKKELKFLVLAFSAMAINKLFATYLLANAVFTNTATHLNEIALADNLFEIFALFLVANAFIYPLLLQKKLKLKKFMADRFILIVGVSFILSVFTLSIIDLSGGSLRDFWTNTSVNVAEVVLLLYYAGYIISNLNYKLKYKYNIIAAFIVYTISPVIELFNIALYDNMNQSLTVATHPFPFISILMFTQVIYLKLVDKATLQYKLRESEEKYTHEKELSKLKDEFISTVSHELKTPLTSMKLYVGLLKEDRLGKTEKRQKDALGIINNETDRLNSLITDILDLSRLEANKEKLLLSEFDLHTLVSDNMYINMAKKKGISTTIKVPPKSIVTADKNKIKQVFINLFNNAIKFTPEGGMITVGGHMRDEEWEISVADTGIGMKKDKIPRMFEKFYQGENYMTRTAGGIGLGLAIVKGIVELHKGRINVESEVGKGTKITTIFPKLSAY